MAHVAAVKYALVIKMDSILAIINIPSTLCPFLSPPYPGPSPLDEVVRGGGGRALIKDRVDGRVGW